MDLYLKRDRVTEKATLGHLVVPGYDQTIYTLEDVWMGNKQGDGRIPAGTYHCIPHGWEPDTQVKMKHTWQLLGVPGRDAILIHAGNTDVDTHGCILVGLTQEGDDFIGNSRAAVDVLRSIIGNKAFVLTIQDVA